MLEKPIHYRGTEGTEFFMNFPFLRDLRASVVKFAFLSGGAADR